MKKEKAHRRYSSRKKSAAWFCGWSPSGARDIHAKGLFFMDETCLI
jgi:hypothetical protein